LARRIEQHVAVHLWAGTEFCRRVLAAGVDGAAAIYGFNSASLELLQYARRKGIFGIVEQTIAPALLQSELLAAENEAYPAWRDSGAAGPAVQRFAEHEKAEWEASSLIVCASEFVRQGIAAFGGPAGRCAVVPYGVDWKCPPVVRSAPHQPLRVLTVGAVGLRKGSPYVFQAAKLSKSFAVFRMAGALAAPSAARQEAPANVELPGPIPRAAIASEYDWADVFLLPSLCEGSATATYEALAAGLPVIATPNTGSVVRDGVDGFIVPIRDPQAIAARLDQLASSPQLFAALAANARRRAAEYTIPRYGERLLAAIEAAGCPLEIAVVQD
jgi:glycosyltransferase involved in cell wall biosynthesis